MKKRLFLILFSFFFLFSCSKRNDKAHTFNLSYTKDDKNIILNFENNTGSDIVFLTPNVIEFESLKNKDYQNVYGLIKPNQSNKYYQKILDSFYLKTLIAENKQDLIDVKKLYMGHSVFYLKKNSSLKVSYDLKINRTATPSKYKQIYYPYPRGIQENYLERDYIGKFSKLNFGKARFVLQPVIEDSLFIKISEKDTDY
ncbi:hypothetical protein [uncultured Chryseobacterium sp.]|mgnify:CR=1 FL=1|jgi:hypothetical protein|uniref:hypothetical protein n=1 Tax=uncultured Chryseobacterium sp. TaxID=259322 RepID=UPI00260E5F91|nr:hypothetical protein [uncultured Chryseobacterium sp.]